MFITDLSIKRPVVSAVFSLILVVFGLFVFWKLPVRELPSGLQPPVVQVQVDYQSASAPIVDQEITQIIEDVIGGAEGVKNIDSISENGRSTIKIEFDTSIDLDSAANDIRERIARIVDNLPEESKAPQILKQAAGFTTTMWLSLSSSTWSDLELGDYARRHLVDSFSSVKNVGRILVGGLRELSIRVWIDPIKLAANDLTIQEVEQSLRNENVSLPAGTLEAENVGKIVIKLFNESQFDVCKIFYNKFKNVITQIPQKQQLIPIESQKKEKEKLADNFYEFEPEENEILNDLLPRNISTQIFKAFLENAASEQGSRMTAMDNATRNAEDLVDRLTINYNRSRQAAITKELIEIISGAESL